MSRAFDPTTNCGANGKQGGGPCRMTKGARTNHPGAGNCWLHGGRTPNGEQHAERAIAEAAVAKLGLPTGTGDPFVLLEKAVRYAEGYLEATGQLLVDVVEKRNTSVALEAAAAMHVRAIRQGATTGNQAVSADVAERLAVIDERAEGLFHRFTLELLDRVVPKSRRPEIEAWAAQRLTELATEYDRPGAIH